MALRKQLWLMIVFTLIFATSGNFIFSMLSSKAYLEQQLQMKNIDNVTSLALSMSQMKKDAVTIDLLLSAQFDSGHYDYIGLFDPNGKLISQRISRDDISQTPIWFTKLVPIKVHAGVAQVQDGWSQFGTLKLQSDSHFAYEKLWSASLINAAWSLAIALLSCYVSAKVLRNILKPLDDVVMQAKAIGEKKFITIAEPKTKEFKAVVNAMNSLSNRIKKNVNEESARLEQLSIDNNYDQITGLMNHDYFAKNVDAKISNKEYFAEGTLIITKLSNLAEINERLGYTETNTLLKRIGDALKEICESQNSLIAGRLNGANFAVFSDQARDDHTYGSLINKTLEQAAQIHSMELKGYFVTIVTAVTNSDSSSKLFTLADNIFKEIHVKNNNVIHIINEGDLAQHLNDDHQEKESLLISALDYKRIKLEHYPVTTQNGALIHYESPVRIQLIPDGKWFSAGEFIIWAIRFNLISRLDELVVENAIHLLSKGSKPISVNISASAICSEHFVDVTIDLIERNLHIAESLCFEVPEQGVFDHFVQFRNFCNRVKILGCKVAIEHVGSRISRLGQLHDVGLDYIKIDVSVIRDIDSNEGNKTLLRGLCMIAHSMGVLAIAEGVKTEAEITALKLIGIDGMTGPGIKI